MTPKEKAKELVNKYFHVIPAQFNEWKIEYISAKKCAIIAINEIIDTLYEYHYDSASGAYEYWTEVKEELEKL